MGLTVVAVGACYLDTILSVDHYLREDDKLRAMKLQKRLGGNVPNTLQVMQQLQHSAHLTSSSHLVAALPNKLSLATQQIQAALGSSIGTSHCLYRSASEEAPSSYIIRSLATGSRTIVNYNDLPEMTVNEFEQVAAGFNQREGLVYHFEGRIPGVIGSCMDYLRHHSQAKISVEIEKPGREGLQQLAAKADIVFYSKSWAQAQGYNSARQCLQAQATQALRASHLFCTWGADGAACLETRSSRLIEAAAHTVKEVVDTVGAGDTFNAGALFGLFAAPEWDVSNTLEFANELAAHKVAQEGFAGLDEKIQHWF